MNKKLIILLYIIVFAAEVNAMKRPYPNIRHNKQNLQKKQCLVPNHQTTSRYQPGPFDCPELLNTIIDFAIEKKINKNPGYATDTVNALYQTNKSLSKLVNKASDDFIKKITFIYGCSHETVAKKLCTPQAKKRLRLQFSLKRLCCLRYSANIKPSLNRLIKNNVNLEFTHNYYGYIETPLMITVTGNFNMLTALLQEEKINVNNKEPHGFTALNIALECSVSIARIALLLAHPKLNINQQDHRGQTPLLRLLQPKIPFIRRSILTDKIKILLNKGADPEIANIYGLTPLEAAQTLGKRNIINHIEQAIDKKHALHIESAKH